MTQQTLPSPPRHGGPHHDRRVVMPMPSHLVATEAPKPFLDRVYLPKFIKRGLQKQCSIV